MSYIGEYTTLEIDRFKSVGAYLTDNKDFEVLLPNKYLTDDMEIGGNVTVFIYNDSEDRPVATTEIPKIELNDFAFLDVKALHQYGAFLDWGLEKDLLVPFKEQSAKMIENGRYLVRLIRDDVTDRLIGTTKINRYLEKTVSDLVVNDKVELFIAEKTELGQKAIVNNTYSGLIFNNHITRPLEEGERTYGYVEFIRQDGKIDISLVPVYQEKFDYFTTTVLDYIKANDGEIIITDKSTPDEIKNELGMSKKAFKKAVGNLYKSKIIDLKPGLIILVNK